MPSPTTRSDPKTVSPGTEGTPALLPASRSEGPLAFWFLNHLLERDELLRQIAELQEKGFAGFFLHARPGLLTPYGSAAWYEMLGVCVDEARRRGLEAWLYDEDPYPSGMAGGLVTQEHSEWRASYLRPTLLSVTQAGRQSLDLPAGALVGAFLVQDGKIARIDEHAGVVRTEWTPIDLRHDHYYPPHTAEGFPHWRASTCGPHLRLMLEVENAGGHLVAFTRHYSGQHPWGEYADLMNPAAVAAFIELTHEKYRCRFGEDFGQTIPGIFTDEPRVVDAYPWSPALAPVFHELTGEVLNDVLPHLVIDLDPRSPFLRWAYRESISRAFKTAYIEQIETYCGQAGLAFAGHISPEEDPLGQAVSTPGLMDWLGGMTVPGSDLIGSSIGDQRHKSLHLGQKLASSAAHTRGKNRVLCEAFAVVDWVQDTSWMGAALNWLYSLGVNRLTTHGQFYSIDGPRKREAPPSQFFHASYWEHFGAVSKEIDFLSRELSRGHHSAPVAVYYPSEAFMAWAPSSDDYPWLSPEARQASVELRDRLAELTDLLLTSGWDFDLIDAQALKAANVVDGKLSLHAETYSAVVLPGGWIRNDAAQRLGDFASQGLPLLSLEPDGQPVLGGGIFQPAQVTTLTSLPDALRQYGKPVFRAEGRLIGHRRETDEGFSLFLVNNGDTLFRDEVTLSFEGPYEICDPQTGQASSAPDPLLLEIEPKRAVFLRQSQNASPKVDYRRPSEWCTVQDLSGEWTCRADSDNCLILSEFRLLPMTGEQLPRNEEAVFAPRVDLVQPNPAFGAVPAQQTAFWTTFECAGYQGPLHLVRDSQLGPLAAEADEDHFRFFLNGHPVTEFIRHRRYDPYNREARLDAFVREGRNFLIMQQSLPEGWPLEKGMPFDGVRLFGDFQVGTPYVGPSPAVLSPRPAAYAIGAPGTFPQFGHPYYGGIVIYSRAVQLNEVPARIAIRFETLFESAEIVVNGVSAGILWQPPHQLEMDTALWRTGENRLEIRCSSSPANYLLGSGRPSGFRGKVDLLA